MKNSITHNVKVPAKLIMNDEIVEVYVTKIIANHEEEKDLYGDRHIFESYIFECETEENHIKLYY